MSLVWLILKSERRRFDWLLEAFGLFCWKRELVTYLPRQKLCSVSRQCVQRWDNPGSPAIGGILYKSVSLWVLLRCCGSAPLMRFKSKSSNIPLYIFCLGKSRPFPPGVPRVQREYNSIFPPTWHDYLVGDFGQYSKIFTWQSTWLRKSMHYVSIGRFRLRKVDFAIYSDPPPQKKKKSSEMWKVMVPCV